MLLIAAELLTFCSSPVPGNGSLIVCCVQVAGMPVSYASSQAAEHLPAYLLCDRPEIGNLVSPYLLVGRPKRSVRPVKADPVPNCVGWISADYHSVSPKIVDVHTPAHCTRLSSAKTLYLYGQGIAQTHFSFQN